MQKANDNQRVPTAPVPVSITQPRHPGTGVLCRGGQPVYYGHVRGIYFESTDPRAVDTILEAQEVG